MRSEMRLDARVWQCSPRFCSVKAVAAKGSGLSALLGHRSFACAGDH